jgi:hypothetical protein
MAMIGKAARLPPSCAWESSVVPLYRLLQNRAFEPEMIEVMATAFDDACHALGLAERSDPLRDMVAQEIIKCAQSGERDAIRLRECALRVIRGRAAPDG